MRRKTIGGSPWEPLSSPRHALLHHLSAMPLSVSFLISVKRGISRTFLSHDAPLFILISSILSLMHVICLLFLLFCLLFRCCSCSSSCCYSFLLLLFFFCCFFFFFLFSFLFFLSQTVPFQFPFLVLKMKFQSYSSLPQSFSP